MVDDTWTTRVGGSGFMSHRQRSVSFHFQTTINGCMHWRGCKVDSYVFLSIQGSPHLLSLFRVRMRGYMFSVRQREFMELPLPVNEGIANLSGLHKAWTHAGARGPELPSPG